MPKPARFPTRRPDPAASHQAERPRERLLAHGAHTLTDAELLAILLRTGTRGCGAVALAQRLLTRFEGLRGLLSADAPTLMAEDGIGTAKTCELLAVRELNRRAIEEDLRNRSALDHPDRVKRYCIGRIGPLTVEHCLALYLDNRYRLLGTEELARGTLNQASLYPREVVKSALRHHAAALILAHNHPSGLAEPSRADLQLTRQLREALALVDVRLIDHLIVTPNAACSLAESGQL